MLTLISGNGTSTIKPLVILLFWFAISGIYLALVNTHVRAPAGYIALLGQVGMDIVISILAFKLYTKTNTLDLKYTYLLFALSAGSAMVADCIYHTAMNILDVNYFNSINSFFEIPFIFFLLFQLMAWLRIFFIDYEVLNKKKYNYLPYLTVSIFIFFTFVYIIPWKINHLSRLGIYQLVDTLLEVIGFAFSTLCLARSRNNPIRFLSIGYLLIISSDLLIRYQVVSGAIPFSSAFESSWILGLILMAFGFFYLRNNEIKLLPLNCLQSHIAIWLLNLLSLFVLLFIAINYFFPHKEMSNYLLLVTIPCTIFSIMFSTYFASKILSPLERLEAMINEFLAEGVSKYSNQIKRSTTNIEDFNLLEKFIYDAFDLYKKNHLMERKFAQMATQVAHDIRSPMLALNNYYKEAVQLNKNKHDVVESSLHRINEIANNLLIQHKNKSEVNPLHDKNDIELIIFFLQTLVEEKKFQFKDSLVEISASIDQSAATAFALFNAESFYRTVSNLLNNAVESIEGQGSVIISLQRKMGNLVLEIADTGCGISNDILKNIEQGGGSQKANGNGLGLPYALKNIIAWGARYEIDSKQEEGTQFKIILPLQNTPEWLQEDVYIYDDLNIVIVDDDNSIFKLWKEKLINTNKKTQLTYINDPREFQAYINSQSNLNNKLFLIDYHFNGSHLNGIELISSLGLKNVTLVTSKYPDATMKAELIKNDINYIWKQNLSLTRIFNIPKKPDLILIDDKKIVTETWMIESQKYGKEIITFNNGNTFMRHFPLFDKDTPIYLDLNLEKQRGDKLAKDLYTLGFKNLYITTGQDLDSITKPPWILDMISKKPPFSIDKSV